MVSFLPQIEYVLIEMIEYDPIEILAYEGNSNRAMVS